MPRFSFEKLVRDNIVEQQERSGAKPTYRTLTDTEHKRELIRKLIEEAKEIESATADELAAEVADVQQALDDLKALMGVSSEQVAQAQTAKNAKNGGFGRGLYVEYVDVANDDPWAEYYRQNPDRYPEIAD